jgi:DNA-directed RNA polymerase subunit RPC12/RpoP
MLWDSARPQPILRGRPSDTGVALSWVVAIPGGSEMDEPRSKTVTENEPLRCAQCGEVVTLTAGEAAGVCMNCGSTALAAPEPPTGTTGTAGTAGAPVVDEARDEERQVPSWLADPAALLGDAGEYLCFEDGEEVVVVPLTREWTRVGRGLAADVRFDDPTVSRRHALIVRGVDGVRVLDDRSLNGVFVNGQRVEWSPLAHGDEIRVGRHRLYYATLEPVGAAAPTTI